MCALAECFSFATLLCLWLLSPTASQRLFLVGRHPLAMPTMCRARPGPLDRTDRARECQGVKG
jgi:hypothetical protein